MTEENRGALRTHEVELGESAGEISQRIKQILTQTDDKSEPWPLASKMIVIKELVKISLDVTFVLQFFSQRGLIHIMQLIASGRLPDSSRVMVAMRNMLTVLGAAQGQKRENMLTVRMMHEVSIDIYFRYHI